MFLPESVVRPLRVAGEEVEDGGGQHAILKNPNMLDNITHLVFPQIANADLVRQQLQRERRQ